MSTGLEGLIGQPYLFRESDLSLPFDLVGEKVPLMPGVRQNWSWSRRNDPDGLLACVKRSRCPGWKRDSWRGAPYSSVFSIYDIENVPFNTLTEPCHKMLIYLPYSKFI